MDPRNQSLLRRLPAVGEILARAEIAPLITHWGHDQIARLTREAVAAARDRVSRAARAELPSDELLQQILADINRRSEGLRSSRLSKVVNATGVLLHTSLGRAPLCDAAISALLDVAGGCNLEVDLDSGERRQRGYQLQDAFRQLTGAEAALVVNNNAAATVLALAALASGKEVILSRGQLVEIGGSFRLPEIFETSGALLREVGTTNQTHLADYERALSPQTAGILRVHPSNYRIEGFVGCPEIEALAQVAHRHGTWAIDDIGSGCLVDTARFGLPREPTFQDSLQAGADLVLGSGDKLLGGPQCGILLGKTDLIGTLKAHPLARAFRVDKLTLAALQATLEVYLRGSAEQEIPLLRMLSAHPDELRRRATLVVRQLSGQSGSALVDSPEATATYCIGALCVEIACDCSPVGGGSLATATLPTTVVRLSHAGWTADALARHLRLGPPRVFPRIDRNRVLIDLRSVPPEDDSTVVQALRRAADLN